MNIQEQHQQLVSTSFKNIDGRGGQQELLHAILGLAGEVGELVDAVKKHVFYEKPLDLPNFIEEMGDVEYYMEALRQNVGAKYLGAPWTRETILEENLLKLRKRYPGEVFSNAKAVERADKAVDLNHMTLGIPAHDDSVPLEAAQENNKAAQSLAARAMGIAKSIQHRHEPGSNEWHEFQAGIKQDRENQR